MKRIKILLLSFLLIHGGVAWAFDDCLHSHHHSTDEILTHHHFDSGNQASHDDSQDPSVPVIHCVSPIHQVGPAALAASATLNRSSEGIQLQSSVLPQTIAPVFRNNLWLEALFKKIVTFSLPSDLARYLFLSVLRI
jgi:hypothetical protein